MIKFTILGQCVSMKNSRQIVRLKNGGARLIKSNEALAYERTAQMQIPPSARQMLEGPVRVTLRMFYESERPDLDGALLLDVMASETAMVAGKIEKVANGQFVQKQTKQLVRRGVYINDRQVREIHMFHGIDKRNPRVEVEVEPLLPQQSLLEYKGPWCCEKGQNLGVIICPECEPMSRGVTC